MVIHHLARSLTRMGHQISVLAPKVRGKDNHIEEDYKVYRYSKPSSKRFGVRQLLIPLLWRKLKDGFEILHCHSAYPQGYAAASFKKLTGIPLIITPHGGDILKNERIRQHPKLDKRITKSLKEADLVTAISQAFEEEIKEAGIPREKIRLIPNGINLEEFQINGIFQWKKPYIMTMGRLREKKGFDVLIRAFFKVKESFPWVDLLIAGQGRDEEFLISLIKELKLGDSVHLIGTVQGEEKVRKLKGSLFFVCPSRREPFGIVNIEALACGKPVIGTHVGGIPDVIKEGENGFLIMPEDPQALAQAMIRLLSFPKLIETFGKRAEEMAKAYDWTDVAKRYERVYEEVLYQVAIKQARRAKE